MTDSRDDAYKAGFYAAYDTYHASGRKNSNIGSAYIDPFASAEWKAGYDDGWAEIRALNISDEYLRNK